MDRTEIDRKLKELDDKFRIEVARNKVELIKLGYKSSAEQCDRLRTEIRQNIRRMVQEELMYFKRENYALQRQINAMQQHIDNLKWDLKRQERKSNYEMDILKGHVKELAEKISHIEEQTNVEYKTHPITRI